ncbi:MAG: hypothetical protein AAGA54_15515 [Myxococcota bacterium]
MGTPTTRDVPARLRAATRGFVALACVHVAGCADRSPPPAWPDPQPTSMSKPVEPEPAPSVPSEPTEPADAAPEAGRSED